MKFHPNVEAWLQDLETTTDKQAEGMLGGSEVGYCCLGRACVVYENKTKDTLPRNERSTYVHTNYHDPATVLSHKFRDVQDWLFLKTSNGTPTSLNPIDAEARTLTNLNDAGTSFKEIAKIIRENPDLYLKPEAFTAEG